MRNASPLALSAALACAAIGGVAQAADIWVEGEAAASAQVTRHPWWYDQVKKDQLSGGEFISNWNETQDGTVGYDITVAEAGTYGFWVRANNTTTKLSWRIGGGEWKAVDFGNASDQLNIAGDDKPDLRFISWVDLGKVELKAGKQRVEFRMHSDNNRHGMIDCFTFSTTAFVPKGTRKPGEKGPVAISTEGRWAFDPEPDTFSADALLDLRSLNEKHAGEHGFIGRDAKGDFVRGDGQPIRFWAMHSDIWQSGNLDAMKQNARFLAKRGVNLVRYHGTVVNREGAIDEVSQVEIDKLWAYVAAMKAEGIYVLVSPYYPHAVGLDDARKQRWGITTASGNITGLVYFDPTVQAAYKKWVRAVFEPKNPHTGVALKDEPSVAVIQMQNEDSLLFWTMSDIANHDLLRAAFGTWAAKKHGSAQAALDAWKQAVDGDDAAAGRLGLVHIWDLTSDGVKQKGATARVSAQAQFLSECMYDWHAEVGRFLKEDIGAKQLVNAGNWRTADPVTLGDLERYAYSANDVQGMNRYTGSYHAGQHNGWAVVAGDTYAHYTALKEPTSIPVGIKQPVGMPFIIPESSWVPPTMHQSEAPFLIAAYSSLGGVDAYLWFASGDTTWTDAKSANGYLDSVGKWIAATPELLGNFPAAAVLYRKGYLKPGDAVVHEERALEDMWALTIPVISEEGAFDPNRDAGSFGTKTTISQEVSRLAYMAGRVEVVLGGDPAKTTVHPKLGELIDEKAKVVKAVTGEIALDYGTGICRIDAPKAQGVSGFLKEASATTALKDLVVESGNDYATVLAVALDDQPLASSTSVLVQMGTHCRPTGWAETAIEITDGGRTFPGFRIDAHGKGPWQIVRNDATITLKNAGITEVVALDMNGLATGPVKFDKVAGGVKFRMPEDAKYVIAR